VTEKVPHVVQIRRRFQQPTGKFAPEVMEMEIVDTGTSTGVPPRRLDTRESFPDRVPEDVGVGRQRLSRGVGPAHLQHRT
jgi:hypothetical protein